jgi:hypothetical protein
VERIFHVKRVCHSTLVAIFIFMLITMGLAAPPQVWSGPSSLEAGLRAGWSFNDDDEAFNQYDMHLAYGLPWSWQWGQAIQVDTNLTTSVGVLSGGDDAGLVGQLGFEFVFSSARQKWPFEIRAGSALTLISEDRYGDEDLGGPVQFTHHIGLYYWFLENLSVMARVQHMSNAGIYDQNPGLDMVMLGLDWRF